MTETDNILTGRATCGNVEDGVFTCPKRCLASIHRDRGFYSGTLIEGGALQIPQSQAHSLLLLLSGTMLVDSLEAEGFVLESGHMVLCYRSHTYQLTAMTPCEYIVAYFPEPGTACDMAMLQQRYRTYEAKFEFGSLRIVPELASLLGQLQRLMAARIPCQHMHVTMLEMLFVIIRFYYTIDDQLLLLHDLLNSQVSFRTLVKNALPKVKRANELAALCGYDTVTFNKVFRRHFDGMTPYIWMQEQRKDFIISLLRNESLSIGEVREQGGFSSDSRLTYYCMKYLGGNPTQVRELLLKDPDYRPESNYEYGTSAYNPERGLSSAPL